MVINGKEIANIIEVRIKRDIAKTTIKPRLAVVLVGDDPASAVYVKRKFEAASRVGIRVDLHHFLKNAPEEKVFELLDKLNFDASVHGIIIQIPLPKHLDTDALLNYVVPWKDVDGIGAENLTGLAHGDPYFIPGAAGAVLEVLKKGRVSIPGKHAVVVGAGRVAGSPISSVLLKHGATVTMTTEHTKDLKLHTKKADILVSAAGVPGLITYSHVKKEAAVIDVGISRVKGKVLGDVDPKVATKASLFTPVPGGVGPITVAKLLENVVIASQIQ